MNNEITCEDYYVKAQPKIKSTATPAKMASNINVWFRYISMLVKRKAA